MTTESSISEPFVLASYGVPKRSGKTVKASSIPTDLYATHHAGSTNAEGYVTVAAQGDGIHVLELSTLHPIISHTLGPSTTFCCPPISRSTRNNNDHICATYAGIASSSETSDAEGSRTIWSWSQNLSASIADRKSQQKKVVSLSHPVSGLSTSSELPSRILASSPTGQWTLLDEDLKVLSEHQPSTSSESKKTFIIARQQCRFLPSDTPQAAIVVSLLKAEGSFRISVFAVAAHSDTFIELAHIPLSEQNVIDVSCSTEGFIGVLTKEGVWTSHQFQSPDNSLRLIPLSDELRLGNLSFTSNNHTSIISLTSSHVLLAGLTGPPSNREIALLIWDLQYSVLLTSRTTPIPSTLGSDKLAMKLVDASPSGNALLVLTPTSPPAERSKSAGTSSILVVPVIVPATSTIANAMGRAAAGSAWLAKGTELEVNTVDYDAGRKKVVSEIREAMDQNRPQNANDKFFAWEKRELAEVKKKGSDEGQIAYGYAFVKDVLNAILRPTQTQNLPYSSQVVKHLLEKKLVSSNMLETGLLPALRLRNDWTSITLAFTSVSDLQELEIIGILRYVLAKHRRTQQPSESEGDDAMQVDSVASAQDDMPTLREYLGLCLGYKVSPTPLRFALRRWVPDVDDVTCLLDVLDGWIAQWASRELQLLPSKKLLDKNEHGVVVVKADKKKEAVLPPLTEILFYVQTLLDVSFVNLVQNPSSQGILKRIQARIEPEISSIDETEKLRGPLHLFAAAHAKALKNAKEASEGKTTPLGDWRQRRKLAQDQAGMGIGLYQLEELVL